MRATERLLPDQHTRVGLSAVRGHKRPRWHSRSRALRNNRHNRRRRSRDNRSKHLRNNHPNSRERHSRDRPSCRIRRRYNNSGLPINLRADGLRAQNIQGVASSTTRGW
jgi:hypothetical protein